jgi:hypothetical protein
MPKDTPSVVVCYYDPNYEPEKKPKRIAERYVAEVILLCNQLGIVADQLSLALRRKDIDDVVNLCQFHHENCLFRVYALDERAWEALKALTGVKQREKEKKIDFLDRVLFELKVAYPEVHKVFSKLRDLIALDRENRNVATHRTFLFLGLSFGDDYHPPFFEIDSVLLSYDPHSEDGRRTQQMVREALAKFVAEEKKHIQEIISVALDLTRHCHDAINRKWDRHA